MKELKRTGYIESFGGKRGHSFHSRSMPSYVLYIEYREVSNEVKG
jgi:hypothetical protein